MKTRFSSYFDVIGCRGRVELEELEGNYGIMIKVAFRSHVALQPLLAASQSGGEKSVSTMLYLLCLQEVTKSPFRMVDEINQVTVKSVNDFIDQKINPEQMAGVLLGQGLKSLSSWWEEWKF